MKICPPQCLSSLYFQCFLPNLIHMQQLKPPVYMHPYIIIYHTQHFDFFVFILQTQYTLIAPSIFLLFISAQNTPNMKRLSPNISYRLSCPSQSSVLPNHSIANLIFGHYDWGAWRLAWYSVSLFQVRVYVNLYAVIDSFVRSIPCKSCYLLLAVAML